MTKECSMCVLVKDEAEFAKNRGRPDGLQSNCRSCMKLRNTYSKEELPSIIESLREGRLPKSRGGNRNKEPYDRVAVIKRNTEYINSKKDKCSICGYSKCKKALHFHHKIQESKKKSVATMRVAGYSLNLIQQEIDKCIIVCANCHAELHDEL